MCYPLVPLSSFRLIFRDHTDVCPEKNWLLKNWVFPLNRRHEYVLWADLFSCSFSRGPSRRALLNSGLPTVSLSGISVDDAVSPAPSKGVNCSTVSMPSVKSSRDSSSGSLGFHQWRGLWLGCQIFIVFPYLLGCPEQLIQLSPFIAGRSASSGVTPRSSAAHKYALPPNRTHQILRPCGPIKAAGPRYRPRIAVSARLPG